MFCAYVFNLFSSNLFSYFVKGVAIKLYPYFFWFLIDLYLRNVLRTSRGDGRNRGTAIDDLGCRSNCRDFWICRRRNLIDVGEIWKRLSWEVKSDYWSAQSAYWACQGSQWDLWTDLRGSCYSRVASPFVSQRLWCVLTIELETNPSHIIVSIYNLLSIPDASRRIVSHHFFRHLHYSHGADIPDVLLQRCSGGSCKIELSEKIILQLWSFYFEELTLVNNIGRSEYYSLDREMQKRLVLIMLRSQRSSVLIAGNVFWVDTKFFTSVRDFLSF